MIYENIFDKTYRRLKDLMRLWTMENGNEVELTDGNSILLATLKYDYEAIEDDYPLERLERVEYRLPLSVFNKLSEEEKLCVYKEVQKGIEAQIKMSRKIVEDMTKHLEEMQCRI